MHFLPPLLRLLSTDTAHAQNLGGVITAAGNGLFTSFGGTTATSIAGSVAGTIASAAIMLPLGIYLVVSAGFSLIISQDEGKLATAKRKIGSALVGMMLIFLSGQMVAGFYTPGASSSVGNASIIQDIIYGVANWSLVLMAALGILMIVVSVIRAIASFGKEEGVTNMRQTITGVATGFLMIALLPAVKITLGIFDLTPLGEGTTSTSPTTIIVAITGIVAKILSYLALIAVIIVVYAGIRMIVNLGSEEEYTKSRGLIGRALTGLVVILLSYTIVNFILQFQ